MWLWKWIFKNSAALEVDPGYCVYQVGSFLLLSNISYAIVYLTMHPLMDIWLFPSVVYRHFLPIISFPLSPLHRLFHKAKLFSFWWSPVYQFFLLWAVLKMFLSLRILWLAIDISFLHFFSYCFMFYIV